MMEGEGGIFAGEGSSLASLDLTEIVSCCQDQCDALFLQDNTASCLSFREFKFS